MKYRAFISYSQKDKVWAQKLHQSLERFRVPMGVVANIDKQTRSLGRIFRDNDEMGASESLGDALEQALSSSETLIVLCSPHSAKSKWVDMEVRRFKQLDNGRVFAVIVDGVPNAENSDEECFCPSLKYKINADGELSDIPDEPLAPDWRQEGDARIKTRLAAGILDVDYDHLWQREKRRTRRNAGIAVAVSLAIAATVLTAFLLNERTRLLRQSADLTVLAQNAMDAHTSLELEADRGATAERALRFAVLANQSSWLHEVDIEATEILKTSAMETRAISAMQKHKAPIRFIEFVAGTDLIISIDADHQAVIWDYNQGSHKALENQGAAIFALSVDGRFILSSDAKNDLVIRDILAESVVSKIDVMTDTLKCASFSPDSEYVAVCLSGSGVQVHEVSSGQLITNLDRVGGDTYKVEFDEGASQLTVATEVSNAFSTKTVVTSWDIASGELVPFAGGGNSNTGFPENEAQSRVLSSRLVDYYRDDRSYFYFLENGEYEAGYFSPNPEIPPNRIAGEINGAAGKFASAYFYGMGDFITTSEDGTARAWFVTSKWGPPQNAEMFRLEGHSGGLTSVSLNQSLTMGITGSETGEVRLWDVSAMEDKEDMAQLDRVGLLKRVCDPALGYLRGTLRLLTEEDTAAAPQVKNKLGADVCAAVE